MKLYIFFLHYRLRVSDSTGRKQEKLKLGKLRSVKKKRLFTKNEQSLRKSVRKIR